MDSQLLKDSLLITLVIIIVVVSLLLLAWFFWEQLKKIKESPKMLIMEYSSCLMDACYHIQEAEDKLTIANHIEPNRDRYLIIRDLQSIQIRLKELIENEEFNNNHIKRPPTSTEIQI